VPSAAQQATRPGRVAQLIAEGVSALERGDEKTARSLFQKALAANPRDVKAHTYLAVLADRAGHLDEAERHFAAAAKAAPQSPSARNNYGAILLRLGRLQQAAAQFEASLRLDQSQLSALVNLAQIRFTFGTPEELRKARELFERARAIAPDAGINRALLLIALRLSDKQAASGFYRDYEAQLSGSGDAATSITPAMRAELGAALFEVGLINEAMTEFAAAVKADPANTKSIVRLAHAQLAQKDVLGAGRTLEAALARGLDEAPIYAALADIYEQNRHIENAIPAMRLAIQRDPENEAYRFRYAMLLTDTKAPAAAVIRLQEALEKFSSSPRLWFALGVAYSALHKSAEATEAFTRTLQLDPKFAPALAYLGTAYDEEGKYAEAIAYYERALAIDEKLVIVHHLLGEVMLKQSPNDTARAETHFSQATQLDPTFAPARLSLGKIYARTNRLNEAVNQFERVVALDENLAEAYYQLGRLYVRVKRPNEAQTALATFKRLSDTQKEQTQQERREILRRLAHVRF